MQDNQGFIKTVKTRERMYDSRAKTPKQKDNKPWRRVDKREQYK